jgi:hypothetical protein
VILDANPHSGIPVNCKKVIMRHVPDPSAQLLLLQKGDVDIARNLTPDRLKVVPRNEEFHVVSTGQGNSMYPAFPLAAPEKFVVEGLGRGLRSAPATQNQGLSGKSRLIAAQARPQS